MSDQNSFAPNVQDIDKCTRGLVQKFESPVQGIDAALEVINNKQVTLQDKIIGENEKFEKVAEEYKIDEMIQKTRAYQAKLSQLQKEMSSLSDRSTGMKQRAMKLQECKQKEALKRELRKQEELEREEALVARPAAASSK